MALNPILSGQIDFMRRGGPLEMGLRHLRDRGLLPEDDDYVFQPYPKMIRISKGIQEIPRQTTTCDKQIVHWTDRREVFDEIIVGSEEEEERVLSGGRTSTELEEERLGLLQRCRTARLQVDPGWTAVRLRRELGEALDVPAPGDNMAKLEAELAGLKKMAAMQTEIEVLRAQLAKPADDIETMRAELTALGVKVDGRWSAARLREELDRATDPEGA